jgi:hypothetical protein
VDVPFQLPFEPTSEKIGVGEMVEPALRFEPTPVPIM